MFMAENADHASTHMDRRIHHRPDFVWQQVAVLEFAGAWIRTGIFCRENFRVLESLKIGGTRGRGDLLTGRMPYRVALHLIQTDNRAAISIVTPHADPLDTQGPCDDIGNLTQGPGEISLMHLW